MNLRSHIDRLLSRVYKRELDPERAARTYRQYDIEHAYAEYHDKCKAGFTRSELPHKSKQLRERGFTYLDVLSCDRARELLDKVNSAYELTYIKKDTKHLRGFNIRDKEFIRSVLSDVFTEQVDKELVAFFESEYLVHWVTVSMTPQAREQESVSFRWHCDKGPTSHLKLILYLNPTTEHGGNTEFIDLADTSRVAKRGYLFGLSRTRTSDIQDLSRIAESQVDSHIKDMNAGECVLFQPASVLHRGVSPQTGARYVVTLCLLPSPVHWQTAWERGLASNLAIDEKWHENALEIFDIVNANKQH